MSAPVLRWEPEYDTWLGAYVGRCRIGSTMTLPFKMHPQQPMQFHWTLLIGSSGGADTLEAAKAAAEAEWRAWCERAGLVVRGAL